MRIFKKNVILFSVFALFILLSSFSILTTDEETVIESADTMFMKKSIDIVIKVSPATAKIREIGPEGPIIGTSGSTVTIDKHNKKTLYITETGYDYTVVELDFDCKKKRECKEKYEALEAMQNLNIKLLVDKMYDSSSESGEVNKNITITVKKDRKMDEAWKILQGTILNYFDVLEANDENSGYLRTAWVGSNFPRNTTRERIIIKKIGDNPIKFSLKFISEQSGQKEIRFDNDSKFTPHNRILKKYDPLIGELMTKLSN